MEIIVERRNPRDLTDLRNPGLEHISKIALKTIMCPQMPLFLGNK